MGQPSVQMTSWCSRAREALTDVIGAALARKSVTIELGKWKSEGGPVRARCLAECVHLSGDLLTRVIDAFDEVELAVELAAFAWDSDVFAIERAAVKPEAARSRALTAIERLEKLVPLVDLPERAVEAITVTVACKWFKVSRKTLIRSVKSGILKDHRSKGAPPNAPLLLSPDEIERFYDRR